MKFFLLSAVRFVNILPHRAALRLGAFLGAVLWFFSRRKVDRAEARCVSALGMGVTLARSVVRKSYIHMGKSIVEFARVTKLRPRLTSLVSIEGREHLDEALKRGKGVLLMTAHMGNWELAGARLVAEGYAIAPIYTPQRNKNGVNDLVVQRRARMGMKMIPSEGWGMRELFRVLRQGGVLVFLQDLDARKEGVSVPFLGLPARTATGIVKMHRKFGVPVVPAVTVRNADGIHHTIRVQKILSDVCDEDGSPFGVNVEKSLKMCNNILSQWVAEYPEQWMWLLDKWESALREGDVKQE
ncbi:MAG: lysophospholipid acyltransferase family protein [Synergistaceae bacterium]|jgi:KDO2-lipid IV(A) lauroyltransferase|nr:lysophospholipid acyltransferase family protein [Synergistaceae bacterium]